MAEVNSYYFAVLHKDRSDSADTFEKPSTREMWRSIVEKYSDQAHFIYELIQNADDAGATTARFLLEPERLIFAHNGTRHFSISNPENEDVDFNEGRLGDINAITGIAFSNKKTQENKIGKFGVGFKAVFQYTATPYIYDPEFYFRIDRYIVPSQIDNDFPGRKPEETLFVFPFDHKDRKPQETYTDIARKLKDLPYPVLFLTNLMDISFEVDNQKGLYGKTIIEELEYNDGTIAQKICLLQSYGNESITKNLWLFTRYENELKYSVGFFINEENHLIPVTEPAFCFFPTKENTSLNFIIHAPFMLTDSREGIRTGTSHNNKFIHLLAQLAGTALFYLRNIGESTSQRIIGDDIFSIIPVNENAFCDISDTSRVSFKPFYTEIRNIFETERIIPTRTGYTRVKNAYWAAVPFLTELFNDSQLAEICGNPNAKWGFVSLGRDEVQRNNKSLFSYIDSLTFTGLTEQHLIRGRYVSYYSRTKDIKGITPEFIEKQSIEWLHSLYKWLSYTADRTDLAKTAPIFLDTDSKAVSAYDEDSERWLLFLPSADIHNCRTVHDDLLKNKETAGLIKKIGMPMPSVRDEIYNVILPMYDNDSDIDTDTHFRLFFTYYRQCPQEEVDDFISEIRNYEFVSYSSQADPKIYRGKASDLYFPSEELCAFLESKPSANFVTFDEYLSLVGSSNERQLKSFLMELGVKQSVSVYTRSIEREEQRTRSDLPNPYSTYTISYSENEIDGCRELVNFIIENQSQEKSVLLWNQLTAIASGKYDGLNSILKGTCKYFYYRSKTLSFTASLALLLKTSAWLVNKNGEFVTASNLSLSTLSDKYNLEDGNASGIAKFLSIEKENVEKKEDNSNLTDIQREKVELADYVLEQGFTKEDLEDLARIKKAREAQSRQPNFDTASAGNESFQHWYDGDENESEKDTSQKEPKQATPKKPLHQTTSRVAKEILNKTTDTPSAHDDSPVVEFEDVDEDEYMPSSVNYRDKVDREKEKAAQAIDRIAYQEELQQRAINSNKYSYRWFKALLELETLNSNANNLNNKEVSISFARVEREPGTNRTLILKQPSRYIPQFMEDLADIPLQLLFGEQTRKLAIEVASVKSYTLRVKLKSHVDISDIDFSKVSEARIDAKSPVFLLEELRKQLIALDYADDYDMQENLSKNIEFVFGPPGAGKTTHLAKMVLIPLMQKNDQLKILVLTPTNKAADVLIRKIMDDMKEDTSYHDWLVRFGGTGDEMIEQSPVYRDKTFDIRTLDKNVTVTTIARFPYDFFMPQGVRIFLDGINWDYIVIDEASMIPLVNIIYPLYKKVPRRFIIAGDPFQIEPITSVDLWKNENIYTMVQLDSFVEPRTIPHNYEVKLLTTQYRSVPSIGSIFSKFAYGGILQHFREESNRRPLNLDSSLGIAALNIIKFPVSKYESIYRSKRLQHSSSYQIYSALFTYEYASYFAKELAKSNQGVSFRIGIIAPYRAQADLIEKLIGSEKIPSEVDIQVGTIHGFQGDECDIIFAVFNTPPSITSRKDMFLNKRNIINVSISRAKDYLFVIMPDDNTENINNLRLIKRVEQYIKNSSFYSETQATDLEKLVFGSPTYLEDNSFSTGHQSVNVYGLPEKNYEIRSEDTAVDIQIHRPVKDIVSSVDAQKKTITTPVIISADMVEFYWLNERIKKCPFDKCQLSHQAVPVIKKNGTSKKLNMLVCPACKKRYLIKGNPLGSVDLSEYHVSGKELSMQSKPSTPAARAPITSNFVYSPRYGNGEITARNMRNGKPYITVHFTSRITTYDETIAFRNKELIRI